LMQAMTAMARNKNRGRPFLAKMDQNPVGATLPWKNRATAQGCPCDWH